MSMGMDPNNTNNNLKKATLLSLGMNTPNSPIQRATNTKIANMVALAEAWKKQQPTYTKNNINSWRKQAVESSKRKMSALSLTGSPNKKLKRSNIRNRIANETNNSYRAYLVSWLRNRNKYFENANYMNVPYLLGKIRKGKFVNRR